MKIIQFNIGIVFIVFTFMGKITAANLWCYQCNYDLSKGYKVNCNDPYVPEPTIDLVACPNHEPHHCLKAHIFYDDIYMTVRGCVPSRSTSNYCTVHDEFSDAFVSCTFCEKNSCNKSPSTITVTYKSIIIIIISSLTIFIIVTLQSSVYN